MNVIGTFKDELQEIIKSLQALLPDAEVNAELSYHELQVAYELLKGEHAQVLKELERLRTALDQAQAEKDRYTKLVEQMRKAKKREVQKLGRKPKLSDVEKNQIRQNYATGTSMNKLAKQYDVSKSLIFNVVHYKE